MIPTTLRIADSHSEFVGVADRYVIEHGITDAVIVSGSTSYQILGAAVHALLAGHGVRTRVFKVGDNSITTASQLAQELAPTDVVFAVGGGKVLDVGKFAAFLRGLPFVSVPTQASQDGICSPVAVLRDEHGLSRSLGARIPGAILVSIAVIGEASDRSIRSGFGDLVSNLSAVEDWRLGARETGEEYDEFSALTALSAAKAMLAEVAACGYAVDKARCLSQLVNGLVLSGIAMALAGTSRPCSGAEHKISHALDELYRSPGTHGEQVALGTIYATYLRGGNWHEITRLMQRVGLPATPECLGLTREQMIKAILHAPSTRPQRYTVLEQRGQDEARLEQMLREIGAFHKSEVVVR